VIYPQRVYAGKHNTYRRENTTTIGGKNTTTTCGKNRTIIGGKNTTTGGKNATIIVGKIGGHIALLLPLAT
jgi:hypothetical protein